MFILITNLCIVSCIGQPVEPTKKEAQPNIAPDIQAFAKSWQSYTNEINEVARQADCAPRFFNSSPQVQRRGAVLMLHGFGGCPQQFFELGRLIAAKGFDVLLPLLPGHGLLSNQIDTDDLSLLPGAKQSEFHYPNFARHMNEIMAQSPGTRIIVGFSFGGALGLNATLRANELYHRQLLISPMLAIRGGTVVEGLTALLGRIPGIRNIMVKPSAFRKECKDWQSNGRAGFCDYRFRQVVPLLDLEDQNREFYRQVTLTIPVQIVGAGDERYISDDQLESLTERQRQNGPISLCFMPADVPHEMLSSYENTAREMYWLSDLLNDAVAFVAEGQFFPTSKNPDQDPNASPRCRITSATATATATATEITN